MANFLKTKVLTNIGTTPINVLSPGASSSFTVIGCNIANKTDYSVLITITITDELGNTGIYINQLAINQYSSAKLITNGEKLILGSNCVLTIVCDTLNGVDAVISYAEL